MHKEGGHIVETPVEARAGFLDRPVLVVLTVSIVTAAARSRACCTIRFHDSWLASAVGAMAQPKGGDPVSHCLSPRSPASLSWIVTSSEVRAA